MKVKSGIVVLASALLMAVASAIAQEPCFPGFKGELKVNVNLQKGPNNRNFDKYVSDHLEFLKQGFLEQKIQFAGPMVGHNPPESALIVLNTSNIDEAKRFAKQDPMVIRRVFKPMYSIWLQCVAE